MPLLCLFYASTVFLSKTRCNPNLYRFYTSSLFYTSSIPLPYSYLKPVVTQIYTTSIPLPYSYLKPVVTKIYASSIPLHRVSKCGTFNKWPIAFTSRPVGVAVFQNRQYLIDLLYSLRTLLVQDVIGDPSNEEVALIPPCLGPFTHEDSHEHQDL